MGPLNLRYVLYLEDGLWVAHSLEMDLIGVSDATPEAAVQELKGNMEAQLSFAASKKINPFRSAAPEIQKLWEEANLSALGLTGAEAQSRGNILSWTPNQLSRLAKKDYQCA